MVCLNYGDTISLYRYESKLVFIDGTWRVKNKLVIQVANNTTIRGLINKVKSSLYSSLHFNKMR